MRLTVNNWFDDETGEHIATKFYIDGEECSFEEYEEMYDEFSINDEYECDGNCAECEFNDELEHEPEENKFLRAVTDAVNDTLEMFEDETTCDDCKAQALLSLVMLGADGALQGYVGRNKDLN